MADFLGRYYTKDVISNLLIDNLETETPGTILDLGIGDASLSKAAFEKWGDAKFYATEIDQNKAKVIEENLNFIKLYNYDTLCPEVSSKLKIKFGPIDVAICNPPYSRIIERDKYADLFKSANSPELLRMKVITSEIVFFVHNINLLKTNGELGIILSDSLITGKEFKIFRELLLTKFSVRMIIQLPENIFCNTEAKTHILFITKQPPLNGTCQLFLSDSTGQLSKAVSVNKEALINRMDYSFHRFLSECPGDIPTLGDLNAVVVRGRYSQNYLQSTRLPFFHSTDFKRYGKNIWFHRHVGKAHKDYSATKGDILLCRVGKRVVGKCAMVSSGTVIITDCIYKISVERKHQKMVFESLRSEQGKKWIAAYAHGVCSLVLSKSDLFNFPVFSLGPKQNNFE